MNHSNPTMSNEMEEKIIEMRIRFIEERRKRQKYEEKLRKEIIKRLKAEEQYAKLEKMFKYQSTELKKLREEIKYRSNI